MADSQFRSQKKVALKGSERKPFTSSSPEAAAAFTEHTTSTQKPGDPITVSVLVRRKAAIDPSTFQKGRRLSHEEFDDRHGADPAAVEAVHAFAQEHGLTAETAPDAGRRTIYLTGTESQMEEAFGVKLQHQTFHGLNFRTRSGPVYLPEGLSGLVEAVLGLDNRPQAKPHFRKKKSTNVSYTPVQVAELYGFPSSGGAAGQTIGIIELGGGFRTADLSAYFSSIQVAEPTVTAVSVDGGKNTPGNANGADGEVMLDIEVSGAVAPGAAIAVYFTPNTSQGFVDAISSAVHDTTNKPSVISISWGSAESTWTSQTMTALDEACQAAAALGVTITVAAGDDGSSDGVSGGGNNVDFPASSPHVLGCGGTKLTGSGTKITSEVVWNEESSNEGATGGGVSTFFALPTWQSSANVPAPAGTAGGRGVPDVAGDADPNTGYTIRVDGETTVIGGTSAVAPLWAGLIALANAANNSQAGFVNPTLYAAEDTAFHDITSGNNGAFSAGPGWDACTGLGSPIGAAVVAAIAQESAISN